MNIGILCRFFSSDHDSDEHCLLPNKYFTNFILSMVRNFNTNSNNTWTFKAYLQIYKDTYLPALKG